MSMTVLPPMALGERLKDAPRLAAPAQAGKRLESLLRDPRAEALAPLAAAKVARALLLGIADHSFFLWSLIAEDPGRLTRLLSAAPEDALAALIAQVIARRDDDEDQLKRAL
ncbi:MAG: bifunctional [glutamine synthetase] adenylyltransferase/[glutamine synthetase]-adenylyl-L-tyrosine phosphorylase, partial [Alphaproteobacteria bacterium]|nr:bifunctional [glutamine synthetase] adenylyltransferase/[glutamine synthetase]-adenylyl-L-tyrosine phosphorylase [Alphaproteobacteria bacterium]